MTMNSHEHIHKERDELQVLVGVLTRRQQVDTGIGSHRPVAMLATAVDAGVRFLMQ